MKVTIITINYNNLNGLKDTVDSVINQDYEDKEYIIIDGGSTDGSKELLDSYSNKSYYWVSEKDKGLYDAMNKGIKKSTGDYIIFMNSGDIFFDEKVLSDVFKSKVFKEDIIYGNTIYRYGNKGILRYARSLNIMKNELPFCHQSAFIKGNLMRNVLYDEVNYKLIADYDFFYKCWKDEKTFLHINKIISIYDTTGVSADKKRAKAIYIERCKIVGCNYSSHRYLLEVLKQKMKYTIKLIIPSKLLDVMLSREIDSNIPKPLRLFKQL